MNQHCPEQTAVLNAIFLACAKFEIRHHIQLINTIVGQMSSTVKSDFSHIMSSWMLSKRKWECSEIKHNLQRKELSDALSYSFRVVLMTLIKIHFYISGITF